MLGTAPAPPAAEGLGAVGEYVSSESRNCKTSSLLDLGDASEARLMRWGDENTVSSSRRGTKREEDVPAS